MGAYAASVALDLYGNGVLPIQSAWADVILPVLEPNVENTKIGLNPDTICKLGFVDLSNNKSVRFYSIVLASSSKNILSYGIPVSDSVPFFYYPIINKAFYGLYFIHISALTDYCFIEDCTYTCRIKYRT
jgi:hypothetical protein